MNNSKGGKIAVRVALISVSVLAFVFAFIFFGGSEYKQYDNMRKVSEKKAGEYIPVIDDLMEKRDYIAVYNYMLTNNISFSYDSEYREYYNAYRATDTFVTIYENLLEFKLRSSNLEDYKKYKGKSLSDSIQSLYKATSEERLNTDVKSDNVREYMEYLRKDIGVFLKAYLLLTDEEIDAIPQMTDSQLGVLIEEKVTNEW